MKVADERPAASVAQGVPQTDKMNASGRFLGAIDMRLIVEGPEVAGYKRRGGTHLILMGNCDVAGGNAGFNLVVDDLRATHKSASSTWDSRPHQSKQEPRSIKKHLLFAIRRVTLAPFFKPCLGHAGVIAWLALIGFRPQAGTTTHRA